MGTSGTAVRTADDLPPATAVPAHTPIRGRGRGVDADGGGDLGGDVTVGGYPPVCGAPDDSITLIGKTTQQL
jgi:hypothetical protein